MGIIVAIFIALIYVAIIIKYPKQMLAVSFLLILFCALLWYKYIKLPELGSQSVTENLNISIEYSGAVCEPEYPLSITFKNNSDKLVFEVSWDVNVYAPGSNRDISGRPHDYSIDKILNPGETWFSCFKLPPNLNVKNHDPKSLRYEIANKYVRFQR